MDIIGYSPEGVRKQLTVCVLLFVCARNSAVNLLFAFHSFSFDEIVSKMFLVCLHLTVS